MASYSTHTFSATAASSVSPSDAALKEPLPVALYVGGAGDVSVEMVNGGTVTFAGVAAGTFLPIQPRRVRATGTTATLIVALYN